MSLTPKMLTFAVTMALGGTALAGNPAADQARLLVRQNEGEAARVVEGDLRHPRGRRRGAVIAVVGAVKVVA